MSQAEDLRAYLKNVARKGRPVIYREAARGLGLQPPNTIHQLAALLETLMTEDAQAGVPLIAALVIGKDRNGLPAPGFFAKARELGLYAGPDSGAQAHRYHETEFARAVEYWGC